MKKIIAFIFLLMPFIVNAQKLKEKTPEIVFPMEDGKVLYSEIVSVEGVSKDELYVRAREWFAKYFNSANAVIQMEDKAAGKIIGKGLSNGYYTYLMQPVNYYLNYTVSITVKDSRYRYEISSFSFELPPGSTASGVKTPIEWYVKSYDNGRGAAYQVSKRVLPFAKSTGEDVSSSLITAMKQSGIGIKSKDDF